MYIHIYICIHIQHIQHIQITRCTSRQDMCRQVDPFFFTQYNSLCLEASRRLRPLACGEVVAQLAQPHGLHRVPGGCLECPCRGGTPAGSSGIQRGHGKSMGNPHQTSTVHEKTRGKPWENPWKIPELHGDHGEIIS